MKFYMNKLPRITEFALACEVLFKLEMKSWQLSPSLTAKVPNGTIRYEPGALSNVILNENSHRFDQC